MTTPADTGLRWRSASGRHQRPGARCQHGWVGAVGSNEPRRVRAPGGAGRARPGHGRRPSRSRLSGAEKWFFHRINDLPGWLYGVAWPLQQIGALAVGLIVAIVALVMHRRRLAVAALLVTVLKLGVGAGSQGGREPAATRDVDRCGRDPAGRRAAGRRELRLRSRRARGRAGRGDRAVPARPMAPGAMGGRARRHDRSGLRRRPQPARRRVRSGARGRHRRHRAPGPRHRPPRSSVGHGGRREQFGGRAAHGHDEPGAGRPGRRAGGARAGGRSGGRGIGRLAQHPRRRQRSRSARSTSPRVVCSPRSTARRWRRPGSPSSGRTGSGPREFVGPALDAGLVELVPEYAGTAAEFYSVGVAEPDDDVTATHDQLVAALAGDPIVAPRCRRRRRTPTRSWSRGRPPNDST